MHRQFANYDALAKTVRKMKIMRYLTRNGISMRQHNKIFGVVKMCISRWQRPAGQQLRDSTTSHYYRCDYCYPDYCIRPNDIWIASRYELEYYIRNVHAQYRATLGWLSNQSLFQFGSWKFSVQNLNHNDLYDVAINKNLVFDSPSACGLSTKIISRYLESNSNIFNLTKSFNATMRQMPYKGIDFE